MKCSCKFQIIQNQFKAYKNKRDSEQNMAEKYNALVEEGETTILQHYASIIQVKKTEAKVNLLIAAPETEQEEKAQLIEMKQNLQIALKQQLATLRAKQKKDDLYPLSIELLQPEDAGKLTKYYIVDDKKWKNAKVLEVDLEEQTAKIKKYGGDAEQLSMSAYLLKVLKEPDAQLFQEGAHCKAIFSGDGEFYPCVIEKIDEEGYHVRYKKYNSQEVVELHRLRPILNKEEKKQEVEFEDMSEFKIPQKLRILPNDPENVKKSKKTKIKALKFAFKNAQVEEVNKQKQQKWKNWNSNASSNKSSGYFKTKIDVQTFANKK